MSELNMNVNMNDFVPELPHTLTEDDFDPSEVIKGLEHTFDKSIE